MQPKPIPPEVAELFDYLMGYASTGNLGVFSTLDKATGDTRYTLTGRHVYRDGSYDLVPLGFLSNTAGDEVIPPGVEPTPVFVLAPERFEEFIAHAEADLRRWADDGGTHANNHP